MIRPSSRSAFEDLPAIAEYPLDEGRHLDAGGAVAALAEQRMTFRWFEIQLHRVSMSIAAHLGDEAGRRIDVARGADRDEEVAGCQRLLYAPHLHWHLPDPPHVDTPTPYRPPAWNRTQKRPHG